MIIGLTGGMGSGKSLASRTLVQEGWTVFDADAEVHALYGDPAVLADLTETFGEPITSRADAVAMVRRDPSRLAPLTTLFGPYVLRRFEAVRAKHEHGRLLVDHPLLFETGWDRFCTFTLAILVNEDIRKARVLARPGMTEERYADMRKRQRTNQQLEAAADFTVWNDGNDPAVFLDAVRDALEQTGWTGRRDCPLSDGTIAPFTLWRE